LTIETAHSFSVSIRYNSELFDAATITRVAKHLEALLERITTHANARLYALKEILAGIDRKEEATNRQQYREANLLRLKTVKRVPISLSRLGSDDTKDYGIPRQSDDRPHLHLNGNSPGSKQR
jgi:SAM-dependent MidA family methyltransferase